MNAAQSEILSVLRLLGHQRLSRLATLVNGPLWQVALEVECLKFAGLVVVAAGVVYLAECPPAFGGARVIAS
jgi:hypothetical protein